MRFGECECERAECPRCGPLVRLAEQVRREFEATRIEARVPTAEIVWWRAQMRAREEAARKAARPILLTQALAIAALLGLLISLAGRLTLPSVSLPDLSLAAGLPLVRIALAAAGCLILAPIALYFALARD
jgi:hypothetical protein